MRLLFAVAASLSLGVWLCACGPSSTQFLGASQFPNGPTGCQARCTADGLEMSGFVYSGEFATSCVCRPRPGAPAATTPPSPPPAPSVSAPPVAVPGVAAVPASTSPAPSPDAVEPGEPGDPATHAADLASRVRRHQMVERRGP